MVGKEFHCALIGKRYRQEGYVTEGKGGGSRHLDEGMARNWGSLKRHLREERTTGKKNLGNSRGEGSVKKVAGTKNPSSGIKSEGLL